MIAVAILALCVAGAASQASCVPPSYSASNFDAVNFMVSESSVDYTNARSYSGQANGHWQYGDFIQGVVFSYDADSDSCTYFNLPANTKYDVSSIRDGAEFLYDLDDGTSAWVYVTEDVEVKGVFNDQCLSIFTTVSQGGQLASANYIYNIETENPDFSGMETASAWLEDNHSQCTEATTVET